MVDEKIKAIVHDFMKEMKGKGVPFYVVGIITQRNNKLALEIVVERPERYTKPEILEKIPKSYQGLKVHIA
ncbi:MAG: hypothetical protein ISS93_01890 [Candidatus Aenigmarchaeota archaeon]|nr:hypothetical protein [Candidatus Aenigmarchaeota archaeon]